MRYLTECLMIFVYLLACSSTPESRSVASEPPPPLPPMLAHPGSVSLADLDFVLKDPRAEALMQAPQSCDTPIRLLLERTRSKEELSEGVEALIQKRPAQLHFCFYLKLRELSVTVKAPSDTDSRQKALIEQFETLTPLARGFLKAHQDSRYLRRLVTFYESWAPVLLYRKIELTPQGTALLVLPSPGPSRPLDEEAPGTQVLERLEIDPEKVLEAPVTIQPSKPQDSNPDDGLKEILK